MAGNYGGLRSLTSVRAQRGNRRSERPAPSGSTSAPAGLSCSLVASVPRRSCCCQQTTSAPSRTEPAGPPATLLPRLATKRAVRRRGGGARAARSRQRTFRRRGQTDGRPTPGRPGDGPGRHGRRAGRPGHHRRFPRFVAPIVLVTVAGAALFTTSAPADLYGVLAPPGRHRSPARPQLPGFEAVGRGVFVRNPAFPTAGCRPSAGPAQRALAAVRPACYGTHDTGTRADRAAGQLPAHGARADAQAVGCATATLDLTAGLVHHRESDASFPSTPPPLS